MWVAKRGKERERREMRGLAAFYIIEKALVIGEPKISLMVK